MPFPCGTILLLFQKAGFEVVKSGSIWVSRECPRCGKAKTGHRVSLDIKKNVWNCFGEGCGAHGGVKDFCREMGWDCEKVLAELGISRRGSGSLSSVVQEDIAPEVFDHLKSRGIDLSLVSDYVCGINRQTPYGKWLWDRGYRFFVPQLRPSPDGAWEIASGRFRMVLESSPEPKSRAPKGYSNFLFREAKKTKAGDLSVIFEGEIDFLTAVFLSRLHPEKFSGNVVFFAVPGAGYTLRDDEIESLSDEVVVFLDRGAEREAERLAGQIYASGRRVAIGKYPEPYKDLNEWLVDKGPDKAAEEIAAAVERSRFEGVYSLNAGISLEVESFVSDLKKLVENRRKGDKNQSFDCGVYSTGIEELDRVLSGGLRPVLYGIAGAPGSGKTSFCLSLARSVAQRNAGHILFVSLDMPRKQIFSYLLGWESGIIWNKVLDGKLTVGEFKKIERAEKNLAGFFRRFWLLSSDSCGPVDASRIKKKIIELKNSLPHSGIPVFVFIDYLQNMKIPRCGDFRLDVADQARQLADIANKLNVPIVAVSQANVGNRLFGPAEDQRPSSSVIFKESRDIEYAIFTGFLLSKEKEWPSVKRLNRLTVVKNRGGMEVGSNGRPLSISFVFDILSGNMTFSAVPSDGCSTTEVRERAGSRRLSVLRK